MKSINLKIKVFSLLLILSSVSPALKAESSEANERRVIISEVSNQINGCLEGTRKTLERFVDPKNNESMGAFIAYLDKLIADCRVCTQETINTGISQHQNDEQFTQVLKLTGEIIGEISNRLGRIKSVLVKHQGGKNAIALIGDLKPILLELTSAATLKQLDTRLSALEQLLGQIECPDVAAKITELRNLILKGLAAPAAVNEQEMLRVIRSRLRK